MIIKREIEGIEHEISLTPSEVAKAYNEIIIKKIFRYATNYISENYYNAHFVDQKEKDMFYHELLRTMNYKIREEQGTATGTNGNEFTEVHGELIEEIIDGTIDEYLVYMEN